MHVDFYTPHSGAGREFGYSTFTDAVRRHWLELGHTIGDDAPVRVAFCHPKSFQRDERPTALFSMYEAPDMPREYVEPLNQADAVIVPTKFCRDIFKRNGVTRPIHLCPLGIDGDLFYPDPAKTPPAPPYRLLWLGAPDLRKGWDIFARGFMAAFSHSDDDVRVTFKTSAKHTEQFEELVPGVTFDCRRLPREELADLYRRHHIFVTTTRGEGYGLPPLEAMGTGSLVIAPVAGGLSDFVVPGRALTLKTKKRRVHFGVPTTADEVKHGSLVSQLKRAVRNYDQFRGTRERAVEWVHANRTWSHTARRLQEITGAIFGPTGGAGRDAK